MTRRTDTITMAEFAVLTRIRDGRQVDLTSQTARELMERGLLTPDGKLAQPVQDGLRAGTFIVVT